MVSIKLSENNGRAPEAVPYMPAGLNHICCTVNGRAAKRTVMVDAETCKRLNADLQEKLQASKGGEKARPVVLFDHKPGAAAAVPQGFEWDDKRGILLRVEWTQAGREAVEGGNYGYISPAFRLDGGSARVSGLLTNGVEVGSLVNDPAFERNECIAAARAETHEEEITAAFLSPFRNVENMTKAGENIHAANGGGNITQPNKNMETIKKKLGLPPEATSDDIAAAIDALTKKCADGKKRIDEVEAENAQHKNTIQKHKEKAADGFLERLKKDGKVSHHDEDTLKAAREAYLENPERTERIYAAMQPIIQTDKDEELKATRVPGHSYADMSIADCYATINF